MEQHRLVRFVAAVDEALDKVADTEPAFMSTADKQTALLGLSRARDRLAALSARVLAGADDVALDCGAHDAAAWLAVATRTERGPVLADQRLGQALAERWHRLASASCAGAVNAAQARVIAHALDALPDDLDAGILDRAEARLVELAAEHRPRELARLGRHILEVVAPEVADAEEERRLLEEERRARAATRLTLTPLGDGTTRLNGRLPDAVADRLRTYLDAFTSPRHQATGSGTGTSEADRIPADQMRGQAFCALLEAIDPTHLPDHGGDATTVMVTVSLDTLRDGLSTAGVITSDEGTISAAEARRLACTAHLVPAVLGTHGEVLDLGRTTRLFTRAQRRALRLRDRHCRAEGCIVPATWTEAHHLRPWSHGGSTDLANAISLCNWHHHRAHDDRYLHQRLPNGDLRFTRRT